MDKIKDNVKRVLISENEKDNILLMYSNKIEDTISEQYYKNSNGQKIDFETGAKIAQFDINKTINRINYLIYQSNGVVDKNGLNEILNLIKGFSPDDMKAFKNQFAFRKLVFRWDIFHREISFDQVLKTLKAPKNETDVAGWNEIRKNIYNLIYGTGAQVGAEAGKEAQPQAGAEAGKEAQPQAGAQKQAETPAPAPVKPNYVRDVNIKDLQKFLNQYGGANLEPDGTLGPLTWDAIKNAGLVDVMMKTLRNNANPVPSKLASKPAKATSPITNPELVK